MHVRADSLRRLIKTVGKIQNTADILACPKEIGQQFM